MSELIRDVIEINLAGKTYSFPRPVIARRREFQKDALRLTEIWERMDFPEGSDPLGGATPRTTAKSIRLFMELAEHIMDAFEKYCPAIKADARFLRGEFAAGRITDADLGREWGKVAEFVKSPLPDSRDGAAPADTSGNG